MDDPKLAQFYNGKPQPISVTLKGVVASIVSLLFYARLTLAMAFVSFARAVLRLFGKLPREDLR